MHCARLSRNPYRKAEAHASKARRHWPMPCGGKYLPELPVWEPASTLLMPIPTVGPQEISRQRHFPSRLARSGWAAVLVALSALAALSLSLTIHRPTTLHQSAFNTVASVPGRVRHISAYWQRLPGITSHSSARIGANLQVAATPVPHLAETSWIVKSQAPKHPISFHGSTLPRSTCGLPAGTVCGTKNRSDSDRAKGPAACRSRQDLVPSGISAIRDASFSCQH